MGTSKKTSELLGVAMMAASSMDLISYSNNDKVFNDISFNYGASKLYRKSELSKKQSKNRAKSKRARKARKNNR